MNRTTLLTLSVLTGAFALAIAPPSFAGPVSSFQGLGHLLGGGFPSNSSAVSANGLVVVGWSLNSAGNDEAFRVVIGSGMAGLGALSSGSFNSFANGVSDDGSVVVGSSQRDSVAREAFRWTSGGGMVGIGHLLGGLDSEACGVSANGSVVVGNSDGAFAGPVEAFRWTNASGMVGLSDLVDSAAAFSLANDVSADGSVVVGRSASEFFVEEAFRWTSVGGMEGIGVAACSAFFSEALGVSADGSVVVGYSRGDGNHAFRWTSSLGMVVPGTLGGGVETVAADVSAVGSVMVGSSFTVSGPSTAIIWNVDTGIKSLKDVLELQHGLDLTGWTLLDATGVARIESAEGITTTIVGTGLNPDGFTEAYVAVLSTPAVCTADITGDGTVNVNDLLDLLAEWGACP